MFNNNLIKKSKFLKKQSITQMNKLIKIPKKIIYSNKQLK